MWKNTLAPVAVLVFVGIFCLACPQPAHAQATGSGTDTTATDQRGDAVTRVQKLRTARQEKRRHLAPPPGPSWAHRSIKWLEQQRERLQAAGPGGTFHNIYPVLGGLRTGAGITGGLRLDLTRDEPDRLLTLAARASLERYWGLEARAAYEPGPLLGYAFAQYRHMPREDFFGLGMKDDAPHTNFRRDEFVGGGLLGVRLGRNTLLGGQLSYMRNRVGGGSAPDLPDIAARFDADEVPALGRGIDYRIASGFLEVDWRDVPAPNTFGERFAPTRRRLRGLSLDARSGVYLAAALSHYGDTSTGNYTFTRLDVDLHQYLPFRKGYHVLAFRQLVSLTRIPSGNDVPFYLMPALGGKRTIRGFDSHRFHDVHAWLLNAEYRYQVWPLLDVALFTDAGQVYDAAEEIALDEAAFGYGVGLRFKGQDGLFARFDLARSREGFALEVSLSSIL